MTPASQTSMNHDNLNDWNQRLQRWLPNLWWMTEDLLPQLWELTHQLGFSVFTQPGQPHTLNQQISDHFLTMTLQKKRKTSLQIDAFKIRTYTIYHLWFFDGKQSPPATCICQIVLLILNWKVHTVAGKNRFHQTKMLMEWNSRLPSFIFTHCIYATRFLQGNEEIPNASAIAMVRNARGQWHPHVPQNSPIIF